MAVTQQVDDCVCGPLGGPELHQCEHFHIWLNHKRLASVGRILRECWPPPEKMPPADVLESARDRGEAVDRLFADYIRGALTRIPAGTRTDAVELFLKLQEWYDRQSFKTVDVQVLLGDTDHGGVLDFRFDGVPVDLKATYNIEETAKLQVAGYCGLDRQREGYILHVTKRYKEPMLVKIKESDRDDWETLLAHWRMIQRRLS